MHSRELKEVGAKLEALCREGDLQEPDVVIDNHDGSFTALWFEPELAVIIEPDERAGECTGEPEVPSSDDPDPRRRPEFFQAVALIADLCERGGLPKFDHVGLSEDGEFIQFSWDDEEFAPGWNIHELLASADRADAGPERLV